LPGWHGNSHPKASRNYLKVAQLVSSEFAVIYSINKLPTAAYNCIKRLKPIHNKYNYISINIIQKECGKLESDACTTLGMPNFPVDSLSN